MQDARYINRHAMTSTYRMLGNLGAVGAAWFAHDAYKGLYGDKPTIVYPKKYKKQWKKFFMAGKRKGPYTPPRTPRKRRVTAKNARRKAVKTARARHVASILGGQRLGRLQPGKVKLLVQKLQKQSVPKKSFVSNTGGAYAGSVGRTYKVKKTMELKILQKGALRNIEYKGVSTTNFETLFLGHANYTADILVIQFWMSIIKALMIRVGYPIIDFGEFLPANMIGDVIQIKWKGSYLNGGITNTDVSLTSQSWYNLCAVTIRNLFAATANNQFQLVSVEYNPVQSKTYAFTRMWCKNGRFMLHSESELVVQNRTAPAVDVNDQDVIDNQPLKGVMYYGKGNGTQIKDVQGNAISEFVPGFDSGLIDVSANVGPAVINGQQEAPEPHYFSACKRTGAFYLDPGQSKKSIIRDTTYYSISSFIANIFGPERANVAKSLIKVGSHKFFCFEKIIDCVETQPNINVGFEHNLRVGLVFTPGYNTYSNPYYSSGFKT